NAHNQTRGAADKLAVAKSPHVLKPIDYRQRAQKRVHLLDHWLDQIKPGFRIQRAVEICDRKKCGEARTTRVRRAEEPSRLVQKLKREFLVALVPGVNGKGDERLRLNIGRKLR